MGFGAFYQPGDIGYRYILEMVGVGDEYGVHVTQINEYQYLLAFEDLGDRYGQDLIDYNDLYVTVLIHLGPDHFIVSADTNEIFYNGYSTMQVKAADINGTEVPFNENTALTFQTSPSEYGTFYDWDENPGNITYGDVQSRLVEFIADKVDPMQPQEVVITASEGGITDVVPYSVEILMTTRS